MCMRSEVLTAVSIKESCSVCDFLCSSEWLLVFRGIVAHSPSGSSTPLILGLRNPQVNIADISPAVWSNTCEHLTFDYVYVRARTCVFRCARNWNVAKCCSWLLYKEKTYVQNGKCPDFTFVGLEMVYESLCNLKWDINCVKNVAVDPDGRAL
jgi:hypothetical protein